MSNLFTINNGAITDSGVFGKDLTQSTTTTSKKGVKLKKTSTTTPYFSATPTSLYGLALNLSSRNISPIGTLTIEISSKNNGLISTSTYPVSCFTKYLATNNYITIHPQNWQLLELPSNTTLPYYDLYNISLFTSEEDQLSLVGDPSCINVINGDKISTTGEIRDNFSPVIGKNVPSVDLTTSTKDCLISPPNTSYGLGAGYFTIEGFFYFNTFRQEWNPLINLGNGWGSTVTGAWGITYNSSQQKLYLWRNTAVKEVVYSGNCSINLKEWVHLAVVRHDLDVTIWINGVCLGVMQNVSTDFANIQNTRLFINNLIKDTTQIYSDLFVSNIRIIKGSALFNSSFQRPQQNLSIRTNTLMLYGYPYGDQYLTCDSLLNVSSKNFLQFIDVYNKITYDRFNSVGATGTVLVTDSPFNIAGDRTIRFDGNNMFIARESYGTFGSSDFTVELWMKMADTAGTQTVYDYTGRLVPRSDLPWVFINYPIFSLSVIDGYLRPFFSSTTTVRAFTNGANDIPISANQWYHIAIVRMQNVVNIYVNGIKQPNFITLTDRLFSADGAILYIGSTPPGWSDRVNGLDKMKGWVTNLRIIQGVGLYKEDFNISSPLAGANISSPEPLEPYYEENIAGERDIAAGFSPIDVATLSSTYSLVNGAKGLLTTQLNTSTYAISLDKAKKQYIKTLYNVDSVYRVGSSDFTIEAWVYLKSYPASNSYIDSYCICSGHNSTFAYYIGSNQIYGYINATGPIGNINHNIQLNTWTHIAIMRSNNTLFYFQNGILKGKSYGETDMTPSINVPVPNTYNVYIGSGSTGTLAYFDGNILDFRLTRGRAIYIEDPILQGVNLSIPAPLTVIESIPIAKGSILLYNTPHYSSESPYIDAPANSENSIKIYNEQNQRGDIGHSFKYNFNPLKGDFTIELWHKPVKWAPAGTTSRNVLIDFRNESNSSYIQIFTMPSGKVRVVINPENISSVYSGILWVIESNTLTLDTWYHIALGRKDGLFKLYINGVVYSDVYKDYTTTPTDIIPVNIQQGASISIGYSTLYIGYVYYYDTYYQSYGFITDIRITPNQCLYPVNPIPTSPLKDSTDLSIQEGSLDLEIVNSASVFESSDHPYDPSLIYGSMFVNNKSFARPPIALTDAFTIEGWIKPTTDDTSFYIVSCRLVGRANSWVFGYNSSAGLYFAYTDINTTQNPATHKDYQKLIACASILTKNVWAHVVVSRNTNNEWRFFINGESLPFIDPNSFNKSKVFNNNFSTEIAGEFIGYVADVRVSAACLYDVSPSVFLPFIPQPAPVTSDTVFLIKSDSSQDNEFKILDDDFIDISNNLTTDKFVKVYNNSDHQTSWNSEIPYIITRAPSFTNNSGYYYNGAGSHRRTAILSNLLPVGGSSDWTFECFFKGTTNLPSQSHAADQETQSFIPPYTNGSVAAGTSYWYARKWTITRSDVNAGQPILSTPYFGIGLGKQYITLIYNNKPDSTVKATAALPIHISDVWNNYTLTDYVPATPPVGTVSVPSALVDKQRNVLFKHNLTDSTYKDQWHHLVVQRRGEDFICILDGNKLVDDRPFCAGNIYIAGSTSSVGTARIFNERSVNNLPVTLYDKSGIGGYIVFNILPLTKITHIRINVDVNIQQGYTARARNMNLGRAWGEVGGSYSNRFVGPFAGNNIDLDFRYATRSTFSGDTDLRHIRPDNVDNTEAYDECIPGRSIAISWKFWRSGSTSGAINNSIALNNIMYSSDNGATYHQVPSSWFCDTFRANYHGTFVCNTDSEVIGLSNDDLTMIPHFYSSSRVENYTPYKIEGGSWGRFLKESYPCDSLPPIPEKYCQSRNNISFLAANYNSSTGIYVTNIRINHGAIYDESSPPSLASLFAAGPLSVLSSTTLLLTFPRKTAQNNIEGIKNVVGNHEVKYLQYGDRDPVTRNLRPQIFTSSKVRDPAQANVVLMALQNNTFTDNSTANTKTLVPIGSPVTVFDSDVGHYVTQFNGNNRISIARNSDFHVEEQDDFTIELYVKLTAIPPDFGSKGSMAHIVGCLRWYIDGDWYIYISKSLYAGFFIARPGSNFFATNNTNLLTLNKWSHVAVCRQAGVITVYVDGVPGLSEACTEDLYGTGSNPLTIGDDSTGSTGATGYMHSLRITMGQCLYTGPFIPSTIQISETSSGNATATGLVSQSRDNLDPYGVMHPLNLSAPIRYPSVATSTSFRNFYNSSIHVGIDYTRVTSSVERPVGSGIGIINNLSNTGAAVIEPITFDGDFEISCWAYFPNHFQRKDTGIFSTPDSSFGISVAGDVEFAVNTGSLYLSPSQPSTSDVTRYIWDEQIIPINEWVHIALIRVNSKIYLVINGIPVTLGRINGWGYLAGYTNSINYTGPFTISSLHVGPISRKVLNGVQASVMNPVSQVFKDVDFYVEEIVAIKNANRFRLANNSSDISVPVTPLLEDSSTQLLVNYPYTFNTLFEPGDCYYFFGQDDGSVRFPYNTVPYTVTTMTFEFWIRPESANRHEVWLTIDGDVYYGTYLSIGANGTTPDKFNKVWIKTLYKGTQYSLDDCVAINQWMHVAIVKTSTNWTVYIDGVQQIQAAETYNIDPNFIIIGNQYRTANYDGLGFTGAIGYFQISNYAKYTSDFAIPTGPPVVDANTLAVFKPAYTKKFAYPFQTFLYGPKYATETSPVTIDRSPWGPGIDGSYRCLNTNYNTNPRLTVKCHTTDLNFNTSFTIEGWYNVDRPAPSYGYHFFYTDAVRVYINYESRVNADGARVTMAVFNFLSPTFNRYGNVTPSIPVEPDRWYFVQAIYDREALTLSLYVDSILYSIINIPLGSIGGQRCLNSNIHVVYDRFDGYVSNFRISKSVKSTDIPGGPFAVEEDTLVLIKAPYNGGYEYYESKPTVLIQADTTIASSEEPFLGGGSLDSKAYVVIPSNFNPDINLGTKNFTVEWFQKVLDYDTGFFPIINLGGSSDLDTAFGVRFQNSGTQVRVTTGPSKGFNIATSAPTLSVWQHCALVRSSNVWSMYIDKVLAGSTVLNTDDIPPFVSDGYLGCFFNSTTQYLRPGYISNIRIVQEALYIGADIAENLDAPFDNIPGTLFLYQHPYADLKYKYNATASTVLLLRSESFPDFIPTPVGDNRDDCMFFDGVRDIKIFDPNATVYDLGFNNTPYTLELWVYILDSADRIIISRGGGTNVWGKYGNAYTLYTRSGSLCWTVAAKGSNISSLTLKFTELSEILNKWAHVAITYDQNATRMYVNGFLSQEIAHDSLPTYVGGNGVYQVATCDTDFTPYFYEDGVGNYPIELRVGNSKSDSLAPCTRSALLLFVKPDRPINAPPGWRFNNFQLRFTTEERVFTSPADVYVNTYINGVYHTCREGWGRIVDGRVGTRTNKYLYVTLTTTDLSKVVVALMGTSNLIKVNTTAELIITNIHYRYNYTGTWQELPGELIQSSNIINSVAGVRSSIESRPVTYSYDYNSGLFFIGHHQSLPRTTTQTNFLGYISNLRISFGACLYNESTYVIPTAPLQTLDSTVLLLTSPYSQHEFTRNVTAPFSDPVIVDSISFLDYRKYLLTADALPYMSGDFCIETWLYCIRDNSLPEYIFDGRGAAGTAPFLIGVNEIPGKVRVYEGNGQYFDAGDILPRTWHHIAVIRRDKTLMIYIDGRLCNTKVSTITWGGAQLMIGKRHPGWFNTRFSGSDNFMGFLSNIRIVNKDTVYIDSCKTPPEDKLTVEPGTVFLLDTGTDINKSLIMNSTMSITSLATPVRLEDSITYNPLTQKSPWGGDYLDFIQFDTNTCISYAANSSLDLYQTPYLLETWIYPTTKSGNRTILYTPDLHIYIKDPYNSIAIDGVNVYTTTSRLEPFKWYHIVVANNITSTAVFINGELALSRSIVSEQSTNASVFRIGSTEPNGGGGSQFYGYMSNFRFTSYPTNSVWLDKANKIKITPQRVPISEMSPYLEYSGSLYLEYRNQRSITDNSPHLFLGRYNDFTVETWIYVDFAELTKEKSYWNDRYGIWSFIWGPTGQNSYDFNNSIFWSKFELYVDKAGCIGLGSFSMNAFNLGKSSAGAVQDKIWQFVVVQKQGDKIYILIDNIIRLIITYPTYTSSNAGLLIDPLTNPKAYYRFEIGSKIYRTSFESFPFKGWIGDIRILNYAHYPLAPGLSSPPLEPLTNIPGTVFLLTPHELIQTDSYLKSFFNTNTIHIPAAPYDTYPTDPSSDVSPTKILLKTPYNKYNNDIYLTYLTQISSAANTIIDTDALVFNVPSTNTTDLILLEHNDKYDLFDTSFNLSVWIYPTLLPVGSSKIILQCQGVYSFYINSDNRVCFSITNSGITTQYTGSSAIKTTSTKTWYNIVFNYDKERNQFATYINQQIDSMYLNINIPTFTKNHPIYIGNNSNYTAPFYGAVSDIHITRESIAYNPGFIVPPRDAGQDSTIMFVYAFPDAYPARKYQGPTSLRTLAIDTTTTPTNYRDQGVYLSNGTYLMTETTTFYIPTTFTYEAFFQPFTSNVNGSIFSNSRMNLYIQNNIVYFDIINDSGVKVTVNSISNVIVPNQWNHIAAVRTRYNYIYLYINGKMYDAAHLAGQITNTQTRIGAGLNGLLSHARISKTNYYYFIELNYLTSKPTPTFNTSLILTSPYYNSIKYDSFNAVPISTLPSTDPHNDSNDILAFSYEQSITLPDNERFDLNSCMWSYEAWVMPVKPVARDMCLFDKRSTTGTIDLGAKIDTLNRLVFYTNLNTGIVVDSYIPFKKWTHIAITCDGIQTIIHINGEFKQSFEFIPLNNGDGSFSIGTIRGGSNSYCGYMANIRVIRGYAAYTTNSFSLPSAPPPFKPNTSLMITSPYISPYYYVSFIQNIHISSTILPDTLINPVVVREITLPQSVIVNNLFIHKDGQLRIDKNANVDLKIIGVLGLQITSDGILNIN